LHIYIWYEIIIINFKMILKEICDGRQHSFQDKRLREPELLIDINRSISYVFVHEPI